LTSVYDVTKTSAQVALTDPILRELFGMIWVNEGYVVQNAKDYAWIVLYKDLFLQALSDFVNIKHVKLPPEDAKLASTAEAWITLESPFNNQDWVDEMRTLVSDKYTCAMSRQNIQYRERIQRHYKRIWARLAHPDPFSFNKCCTVLGLPVEEAREKFYFYKSLKQELGDNIRIVTPTGTKPLTNERESLIIEASKQGSSIQIEEYLRKGFGRQARDKALSKLGVQVDRGSDRQERNISEDTTGNQAGETECRSADVGRHSGRFDRSNTDAISKAE